MRKGVGRDGIGDGKGVALREVRGRVPSWRGCAKLKMSLEEVVW